MKVTEDYNDRCYGNLLRHSEGKLVWQSCHRLYKT